MTWDEAFLVSGELIRSVTISSRTRRAVAWLCDTLEEYAARIKELEAKLEEAK